MRVWIVFWLEFIFLGCFELIFLFSEELVGMNWIGCELGGGLLWMLVELM